ncbi:hypothetical protein IGI04_040027 [Brassica rapa subsp. trilocularis]|uniref:Uncharacterized protein n=1 Tax=Brassica rapa subsp. trilocularis TaxID=1813537 RepID=A0ABQ7KPM2_BRACM|nr:hypothetical protein IGI04_040027 [Brassica rapa subsp. trilocularis]
MARALVTIPSPGRCMAMGLSPECALRLGAKGARLFKHSPGPFSLLSAWKCEVLIAR